ncbi:hypothetical protein [Rubritalea tangerina]
MASRCSLEVGAMSLSNFLRRGDFDSGSWLNVSTKDKRNWKLVV